jgi:putative transposase
MSDTTIEQVADAEVELVAASVPASDEQLVAMLVDRARSEGLQLTGEGGLLQQLTKRVLESALEGEITDHLGYDKHDAAGRGSGNSRNGTRAKTVLTEVGPVEVKVPQGRPRPRTLPQRGRGHEVRLHGADESGPDRQGPQAVDHALEGTPERLPDRFRRPTHPGRQLTSTKTGSAVYWTHP